MADEETNRTQEDAVTSALSIVLGALKKLEPEDQRRVMDTAATFFGLRQGAFTKAPQVSQGTRVDAGLAPFSEDRSPSPKQFLLDKQPLTDVERVACLAYYLTHYRGTPHFKTLDISKLNTEAAQIKFSNAALAVNNATKMRYLTGASKGAKQLSAFGEQYVMALPDREAARAVMAQSRQRKRNRRTAPNDGQVSQQEPESSQ